MAHFQIDSKARSPWATLTDVREVEIFPAESAVQGEISIPGSKSFTNRALIISALAEGQSMLSGMLRSDDCYWCIDALGKLGVECQVEGDQVVVKGSGGKWANQNGKLYIGAAGTIARFLPAALAASPEGEWEIEASHSMSERPIKPMIEALLGMGADIRYLNKDGYYPLAIRGTGLQGREVFVSGQLSSQFISGLLLSAPYAKETVKIRVVDQIVQHAYVFITLDLMEQFGAKVEYEHSLREIKVHPGHYSARDIQLEADASTACYFFALAAITNGRIRINNLSHQTKQPDIKMLDVFERMGCKVSKGEDFVELKGTPQLKGGFEISLREMSDQALTLAAIAPFADAPITITEVAHIRHHESDRLRVMCEALTQLKIQVEEFEDGLKVYPGSPVPTLLRSYDDHRMAMSLALIGAKARGIRIHDPGCVSKTCPTYFSMLQNLGIGVTSISK